jgi:hypothetical protein
MNDAHSVPEARQAFPAPLDRDGIAVDGDEQATRKDALGERGADAASSEGAVDDSLPGSGLQALYEGM